MTKNKVLGIVGVVVLLGLIYGAYQFPSVTNEVTHEVVNNVGTNNVGSPANSTFNTAKVAEITGWTMTAPGDAVAASGVGTTTYVMNNDASDRIITAITYNCNTIGSSLTPYTGTGLAQVLIKAATSTGAVTGRITNSSLLLNSTFATSSAYAYVASTTPGLSGTSALRVWAAGTALNFQVDATNTAVCSVAANYLAQ